jgi:hypothetical protein
MRATRTFSAVRSALARVSWVAAGALALGACARSSDGAEAGRPATSASVFTDSALFREHCLEADSGHTVAVRRCTPRDQGHAPRRPPERDAPIPPPGP